MKSSLMIFMMMSCMVVQARVGGNTIPYQNILENSDLIAVVEVLDGEVIELTGPERPAPPQRPKTAGRQIIIACSWARSALGNPPAIWAYRARVKVHHSLNDGPAEGSILYINLAYGLSEKELTDFINGGVGSKWCSPGALSVQHLTRLRLQTTGNTYEMLTRVPELEPSQLEQTKTDMDIRWARYLAMKEIDRLVAGFQENTTAQHDTLILLARSDRDDLGEPLWNEQEEALLERLEMRTKSGAVSAAEWQRWWSSTRNHYINAPFRIIHN